MSRNLLLSVFAVVLLCSCGIDYDGTTKLIFEGRVTAPDGTALPGIRVSTTVANNFDSDEISYDTTDNHGYYRMIFPRAKGIIDTKVSINNPYYTTSGNTAYSSTTFTHIGLNQVNDYKIDLGTTQLYQKFDSVGLTINLNNTTGNQILKVNAIGLVDDSSIDYNFEKPHTEDSNKYEYSIKTQFTVAKNQTVTVKYLLVNGTVNEVQVPIGEESVTYTLNY
jgi:hypothetical protein